MALNEEQIRARIVSLLSKREYSRAQLAAKLRERGAPTPVLSLILDELQSAGLVDDERFCQALIAQRLQDGWGYLRIQQDLRQAEVDAATYRQYLPTMADKDYWQRRALELLQRKYASGGTALEPQKAAAYLQRRGFTGEQAWRALEALGDLGDAAED